MASSFGTYPFDASALNGRLRLLPVGAATLALLCALGYGFSRPQPFVVNNALLATPQPLPTFTLESTNHQPFTRDALAGRWSLVFSGYTQCPDVCPTTLSLLAALQRDWPATLPPLDLVFVTVDPLQDKRDDLDTYLSYFDAGIVGLTGEAVQLNRLLTGLGFYPVSKTDADVGADVGAEDQARLLSHSGAVALINPQAQLHALLRAPLSLLMLQTQLQQIFIES